MIDYVSICSMRPNPEVWARVGYRPGVRRIVATRKGEGKPWAAKFCEPHSDWTGKYLCDPRAEAPTLHELCWDIEKRFGREWIIQWGDWVSLIHDEVEAAEKRL